MSSQIRNKGNSQGTVFSIMNEHLKRKEGNRELDARPRGKKTTTKSEKGTSRVHRGIIRVRVFKVSHYTSSRDQKE